MRANGSGGRTTTKKRTVKRRGAAKTKGSTGAPPERPVLPSPRVGFFPPEPYSAPQHAAELARTRALDDTAGLSKAQLVEIYRCLFETRRLEEHLVALYRQSKV